MGVDISSTVVVGLKASAVIRREIYAESITKYNEDTGKPYKVNVNKEKYFIFDKEVPANFDPYPDSIAVYLGYENAYSTGEGSYHYPRREGFDAYDLDAIVIGEHVIDGDSHRSGGDMVKEVDVEKVAQITKQVKENFAKFGYKGEVKLYLVTNVG
jgi:hypothetical protein